MNVYYHLPGLFEFYEFYKVLFTFCTYFDFFFLLLRFCICKYEKILYHIGCQGQEVKKADVSLLAEGVLTS